MNKSRQSLIAGNWKMNMSVAEGCALAQQIVSQAATVSCELLLCPPAPLLGFVMAETNGSEVQLGSQDCHFNDAGAHTGDTSAKLLADIGCGYVILGHSERRADHGETDQQVAAKVTAAWRNQLTAIICIGETESQRDAGKTLSVVRAQIAGSIPPGATGANTVIAYEPVWAIGSGKVPSVNDVTKIHAETRTAFAEAAGAGEAELVRILYGGSLKPENASEFLALEDVDGGLIGGASLKAQDFISIASSCP